MLQKHLHTPLIFIYFFLVPALLFGVVKEIGIPVIQNFERSEYDAGTQNWSITQGNNGVMYFGNNKGLLQYDGQFWSSYLVPNGSNIRSLYYSENHKVLFAGAFNELGYFSGDSLGATSFTSLKPLLPEEYQSFGDVWRIFEGPWGVLFQAFEGLFIYNGSTIEVVPPRSIFHFSYYVNGVVYVFDRDNGLMEFRNGFLKKIPDGDYFIHKEVWSILPLNNDELLIGTAKDGMFVYDGIKLQPWNVPVNELLKKYQVYSSLIVDEQHFAFGTIQNGLIICDKEGNLIQMINREKGLQNNTILSMCLDLDGNLWLGLDNGIDYVELNSPITLLQEFYDFGTGYTSIAFEGKLYLGTNQGLFYCDLIDFKSPGLSASDFKMVVNTSGQVWSLQIINNQLFCGHNNGSFLVNDNEAIQIDDTPGCWAYNKIPGYSDYFIEGTYNGMELYRYENNQMVHMNAIKGINYSCQEMICLKDGLVWVSHAFNGVALYQLNESMDSLLLLKKYGLNDGLPSENFCKLKQMKNEDVLITSPDGIYQYEESDDHFVKAAYYNSLFNNEAVQFIQEDAKANIWYVNFSNEGGVLRHLEDGTFNNVSYPFSKLKGKFIGSFFNFNVMDENNVLIALEKGYAHYNPQMLIDYRRGYSSILNSVSILGKNQILYNGVWSGVNSKKQDMKHHIEYSNNALRFTFTGLFFEGAHETQFSYLLAGFDREWSDWQTESTKEYTNLPEGDFIFRVRSKNKYGILSSPEPFEFTILPPWYKSLRAIIAYFVLSITFVWFWIFLFLKRVERKKMKELEEQRKEFIEKEEHLKREALEAEKEIIRLRNDKLRADMIHKDKELANSAMNLVQKNKELHKIKVDLKKIQSELKEDLVKSRIAMIIRKIDKETSNDESWSVFETNFELVHEDFLKRVRVLHPDITPKELKLSAYLRMNISSKEIATLMNITTRGVEISRYRLRRKFNLERSQNLIDYILSV